MVQISQDEIMEILQDSGMIADFDRIKSGGTLKDAGVDSLDLANFLLAIEEKYKIKIPDKDVEQLSTIDGIISYLLAKEQLKGS